MKFTPTIGFQRTAPLRRAAAEARSSGQTENVAPRIEVDDLTRPEVLALIEEHLLDMHALSPPGNVFAFDATKLKAHDVTFWTAWQDRTLVGCAALKALSPTAGEIKSMRTPQSMRRTGAGRALLAHLVGVARTRGYSMLYLETGRHPNFLPAQALYRSAGFQVCGAFGSYSATEFNVFMALSLNASRNEGPQNVSEEG